MRFVKGTALIVVLFLALGALVMFMEGKADPAGGPQFGKPAMWGGDTLVHQGYISRYSRNGYSADYDDDYGVIFAAVTGHSSGPDTCFVYLSANGGLDWIPAGSFDSTADYSNPQVVIGEGANPYQFYFMLNQYAGEIVLKRVYQTTVNTYIMSNGVESFSATRDDPDDQNYHLHMARATNLGEVLYSYSTNFGQNWQTKDTVDGDMPHIATAGPEGDMVYLTWRLDGEDGAFYGVRSLYERVYKNPTAGTGIWKYYPPFDTLAITFGGPQCLLQASDGSIYVGIDTVEGIMVQKSQNGGETWTSTDDLGSQEDIYDFLEGSDGAIYVATGGDFIGRGAKVYRTTDGGTTWGNTGDIGEITDDWALCLARSGDTIYVGTSPEGDVFRSTNGGTDWTECHELPGVDAVNDIIVTQLGTVIAAGDTSEISWSGNGGDFWYYSESPDPPPSTVWCLFQASDGTILAGASNATTGDPGILKSTNNGFSWSWTGFSSPSGYFVKFIVEAPNSYLYTSDGRDVYRSINHGDTWTVWSGSPGLEDMILSKHQIAVKRSTNRGVTWGTAEVVSSNLDYEKSDPKVAGVYNNSYSVWVTYTEKNPSDHWNLKYAQSSHGGPWTKNLTLAGASESDQHLCDLACRRGEDYYVHAAYCSDETGLRKLYYRYANDVNPTDWSDTLRITGLRPTLAHTPEVCFYQDNPAIFYSWGFGIGPEYPQHLYVNAQHFTDVEEEEENLSRVKEFSLSQNCPNPFNPVTRIQYTVGSSQTTAADGGPRTVDGSTFTVHSPLHITLKIYNIRGKLVRTLVNEPKQAGSYQVIWDGKNENGRNVGSGIYFCRLKVGDSSQTKKMVLIK